MKINSNIAALYANQQLRMTEQKLSKASEKLVTGNKLNHSSDGPAEYALASKLNSQIIGLNQASSNVTDGISVTNIVDGVLSEVSDMLQRLTELATQAGTESYDYKDREYINEEMQQILNEISSMVKTTQFNKQNLLDGTFDLKGYTNNKDVNVKYYSDDVKTGVYNINLSGLLSSNGSDGYNVNLDNIKQTFPQATFAEFNDDELLIHGKNGFELTLNFKNLPDDGNDKMDFINSINNMEINISGFGAITIQTGANQWQTMEMRIPNMNLDYLGLSKLDLSTPENALKGLETVENALTYVNSSRSRIGAYSNRLEYHQEGLEIEIENLTKSYSGIMDADIALTMSEYSNLSILQQANISVLKQLNDNASMALQLLS